MIDGGAERIFIMADREVIFINHAFGVDFCCEISNPKSTGSANSDEQ
jgi:hypothetical protein